MRVPARKKWDGFCHNLVLGHATKISTLRSLLHDRDRNSIDGIGFGDWVSLRKFGCVEMILNPRDVFSTTPMIQFYSKSCTPFRCRLAWVSRIFVRFKVSILSYLLILFDNSKWEIRSLSWTFAAAFYGVGKTTDARHRGPRTMASGPVTREKVAQAVASNGPRVWMSIWLSA